MHNFLQQWWWWRMVEFLFKSHTMLLPSLRPRWHGGRWAARWGWRWWWTACTRSGTAGQSPSPRTSSQPPPRRPRPPASPAELIINMIMWANWNHLWWFPIFMANLKDTQNTSNLCSRYQSCILMQVNLFLCIDSFSLLSNFSQSQIEFPLPFRW